MSFFVINTARVAYHTLRHQGFLRWEQALKQADPSFKCSAPFGIEDF